MVCTIAFNREELEAFGTVNFCGCELTNFYSMINVINDFLVNEEGFRLFLINDNNRFYQNENYPPDNIPNLLKFLENGPDFDDSSKKD